MSLAVRINFRKHGRIAHRDGSAGPDLNSAKQSHILVWRRRIPIHKRDRQAVFFGRKDLDGEHVRSSRESSIGHVEFIRSPCAGHIVVTGDLFPVEKNVGAIIYAAETQPDSLAAITLRQSEGLAIPPRHHEWTVLPHLQFGKILPDRISHPRKSTQIHAEHRVGIDFLFHQSPDYCRRHAHRVPACRRKFRRGNEFSFLLHFAGILQRPSVPQLQDIWKRVGSDTLTRLRYTHTW